MVRLFDPSTRVPLERASVPAIVLAACNVTPLELLTVKLFGPLELGNSLSVVVCDPEVPAYANVPEAP